MRRTTVLAAVAALVAAGCGAEAGTMRYYDPWGHFSADVPAGSVVEPIGPQTIDGLPELLSAVVVSEPQDAAPVVGIGAAQPTFPDQLLIAAFDSGGIEVAEDMTSFHLDDPTADLRERVPVVVGGREGLLVVADHVDPEAGVELTAVSVFAVIEGRAYWVRLSFALGGWEARRDTFLQLVRRFRFDVPASVEIEAGAG